MKFVLIPFVVWVFQIQLSSSNNSCIFLRKYETTIHWIFCQLLNFLKHLFPIKDITCNFFFSGYKSSDIQRQYSGSIDEGVETDFDDQLQRLKYSSLTSSSGVVNFTNSKSLSQNLSCDSNFESLEHVLSESNELASSLPSCTSNDQNLEKIMTSTALTVNNYTLSSKAIYNKHKPLDSCNIKTRNTTRSPVDFREGRRASDGVVSQQVADKNNRMIAFNSQKLNAKAKSKCILDMDLLQRESHQLKTQFPKRGLKEEFLQRQRNHNQYPVPKNNKKIALPDNVAMEPMQLQTAMQQRWDFLLINMLDFVLLQHIFIFLVFHVNIQYL